MDRMDRAWKDANAKHIWLPMLRPLGWRRFLTPLWWGCQWRLIKKTFRRKGFYDIQQEKLARERVSVYEEAVGHNGFAKVEAAGNYSGSPVTVSTGDST